jgi:hypothetical protein
MNSILPILKQNGDLADRSGASPITLPSFPWIAGIAFISYGLSIGIQVNRQDIFSQLPDYLPPGWEPLSSPLVDKLYTLVLTANEADYVLFDETGELARTTELDRILLALDGNIRSYIGTSVEDLLFVHAGVVAWRDRAIVIPGRSYSGKTTLVAALVQAGAIYYSDEYAVFDNNGLVYPYPRHLSVRHAAGDRIKTCPVAALGGTSGTKPLPVGLVVTTHYQSGAQWHPSEISPGAAILALLDNTLVARLRPQFAMSILAAVVSATVAIQSQRGEAAEVAIMLLEQLEKLPIVAESVCK